ncbi:MAG: DUF2189 domain-containing protein [Gammaproteobacteria bacterium]|nr:DUF2189 domain-containing protein [Gammaproteobacteria bacterium]
MNETTISHTEELSRQKIIINQLDMSSPGKWLRAGWNDIKTTPVASLAYGTLFAAIGMLLVYAYSSSSHLVFAITTGFLLLGPFLAVGLYAISRNSQDTAKCETKMSFFKGIKSGCGNPDCIAMYALLLGIITVAWVRLSAILAALFFNSALLTSHDMSVMELLYSENSIGFLAMYVAIGAIIALFVFSISAISIPMIMDKEMDCITTSITSFKAVMKNKKPMLYWAVLIVVFTGIGMATLGLGLIITMPLIGHATWHAYRDLIATEQAA